MFFSRPLNLAILTIFISALLINFCISAPPNSAVRFHSGSRLKKWYTWNNDLEVTKKWYDWQNVPHALQQKRQPFESADYLID